MGPTRCIPQFAQQHHELDLKESWYEKLQRWEDALIAYEGKQKEDPLNFDITMGRMRCLQALGDWERLSQLTQEKWTKASVRLTASAVLLRPKAAPNLF